MRAGGPGPDGRPRAGDVAAAFRLPGRVLRLEPVGGAWSNRVFRLVTDRGSYALKELRNPREDPYWLGALEAAWEFELVAARAGVAMPVPVAAPGGRCLAWVRREGAAPSSQDPAPVRLHRWVDGRPAGTGPVDGSMARWAGRTVAVLHGLGCTPPDPGVFPAPTTDSAGGWPRLVDLARRLRPEWVDPLVSAAPAVRRGTELFLAAADEPAVMSHADVDQKNLLLTAASPVLCDWDAAAPVVPRRELAEAALSMGAWRDFEVARLVVRTYRDAGGDDSPFSPADLGPSLMASLDWVAFNVERALGARPATPAERALSAGIVPGLLQELPADVRVAEDVARLLG